MPSLCFSLLSNSVPLVSVPRYLTITVSLALGTGPVPSRSTLYCKPSGVVVTPTLLRLAARNASPSRLFLSRAAVSAADGFAAAPPPDVMFLFRLIIASCCCATVICGRLPDIVSRSPAWNAAKSKSTPFSLNVSPISAPSA